MKKILSMMAIAAMVCGAFTACDDDDENKTENTPKQAIEATATATSITVTVNPELLKGGEVNADVETVHSIIPDGAPNGYKVGLLSVSSVNEYVSDFGDEGDDPSARENIVYVAEMILEDAEVMTESTPVTFTETGSFMYNLYGGDNVAAGSDYYVVVAPVDEDGAAWDEVIVYETITTPAE